MRWLTIDYIKQHSRIDYDCEDAILELYGEAAEEMVLNITGRTYEEIVEKFGTADKPVPAAIIQASLLLVEASYNNRSAISVQQLYTVDYGFDYLIKRYMKLTSSDQE